MISNAYILQGHRRVGGYESSHGPLWPYMATEGSSTIFLKGIEKFGTDEMIEAVGIDIHFSKTASSTALGHGDTTLMDVMIIAVSASIPFTSGWNPGRGVTQGHN